jgi:hypothetical protein
VRPSMPGAVHELRLATEGPHARWADGQTHFAPLGEELAYHWIICKGNHGDWRLEAGD